MEMKTGRHRCQAVILRSIVYGDDDLIVGFLTRNLGRIDGIAKHGRKSRKRFGNILSPGSVAELEFTVKRGRDLVHLEKGDLVRSFDGFSQDINLLAQAGVALELTEAFAKPLDAIPQLFDLLIWCLDRIDQGVKPEETLFIFQIKFLALTGFGPNLDTCPVCGLSPPPGRAWSLKADHDGFVCDKCSPGGFEANPGTIKTMHMIQNMDHPKMDRIRVSESTLKQAQPFLMSYFRHILGRELKSFRFLEQMKRVK